MTTKLWPALFILFLAACNSDPEDATASVDKSGSIETAVSVEHADSTHDIVLTTHKIWVNLKEYNTVVHRDTVPALGMLDTDAENEDGDTKKVNIKKDYQIFITVK